MPSQAFTTNVNHGIGEPTADTLVNCKVKQNSEASLISNVAKIINKLLPLINWQFKQICVCISRCLEVC